MRDGGVIRNFWSGLGRQGNYRCGIEFLSKQAQFVKFSLQPVLIVIQSVGAICTTIAAGDDKRGMLRVGEVNDKPKRWSMEDAAGYLVALGPWSGSHVHEIGRAHV